LFGSIAPANISCSPSSKPLAIDVQKRQEAAERGKHTGVNAEAAEESALLNPCDGTEGHGEANDASPAGNVYQDWTGQRISRIEGEENGNLPGPLWVAFDGVDGNDGVGGEETKRDEEDTQQQHAPMGGLKVGAGIAEEKSTEHTKNQGGNGGQKMSFGFTTSTVALGKQVADLVGEPTGEQVDKRR